MPFTYVSVDSVIPRTGPTTGAQDVTIRGFGFNAATGVTFGGSAATNVVIVSNTTITATTPAHSSGSVDVAVLGVDTGVDLYTYTIAQELLPPIPYRVPPVSPIPHLIAREWMQWLQAVKQRVEEPVTIGPGQVTGFPLSRVNDTNVTLTLTGTPDTALLEAVTLTLGWTGKLSAARGGLGPLTITKGDLLYADLNNHWATLADVSVGSYLRSGGVATAPLWSTLKLPNSATVNRVVYATATDTWGDSANLTFTGSLLTLTGTAIVTTGVTTGTGVLISADGLTSGQVLTVTGSTTGSNAGAQTTGALYLSGSLAATQTGNPPRTSLGYVHATITSTAAFASAANLLVDTDVTNTTNAAEVFGLYSRMVDNVALGNILHGIDIDVDSVANAAKTIYALSGSVEAQSNTANTVYGLFYGAVNSGAPTSGAQTTTGVLITANSTGMNGGTANVTGVDVTASGTVTSGTITAIGVRVRNGTMDTTGTSSQVGIQVDALSGADNNYAAIFNNNVGIGVSAPTELITMNHATRPGVRFLLASVFRGYFGVDNLNYYTTPPSGDFIIASGGNIRFGSSASTGEKFCIDNTTGNVSLGLLTQPGSGTRGIILQDGTAFASMAADTAGLYADDVSGTLNLIAINEANQIGRLTPSGIPIPRSLAPGSQTVYTGMYIITVPLTLSGTESITLNGTAVWKEV